MKNEKECIRQEVSQYIEKNVEDMAESHIQAYKDRYCRYSKERLEEDLYCNHDFSAEAEYIENELGFKLNGAEYDYCEQKFNEKVIEIFFI